MNKEIIILNGSTRRNGKTQDLVNSFIKGAKKAGNNITEFKVSEMKIADCIGCKRACSNLESPCVQKDDMNQIYSKFDYSDIIVFASPVYFWTITGSLKTATDRLYAKLESLGYSKFSKDSILLMTADGSDYSQAVNWYNTFERNLGWSNLGEVLGKNKTKEAYKLGLSV